MKLTAARPEDLPDCVYLINELGVRDIDTLLDLIEQALPPPRTPTAKMQYFTQEALEAARSAASGPQPAGAAGDAQAPARPEPDTREQPHRWRSFLARSRAAAGRLSRLVNTSGKEKHTTTGSDNGEERPLREYEGTHTPPRPSAVQLSTPRGSYGPSATSLPNTATEPPVPSSRSTAGHRRVVRLHQPREWRPCQR